MSELHELIDKHLDECATPAEFAELDRLLFASPTAAEALARAVRTEVLLEEILRQPGLAGDMPFPFPRESRRRPVRWAPIVGLAAAVLLLVSAAAILVRFLPLAGERTVSHDVLSGRVLVDGVETAHVPDGARVEVAGGENAVIRFADGSWTELEPDSAVVFHRRDGSPQIIELDRGAGRFQVGGRGKPLRVDTAVGTVSASDTEFFVELRPDFEEGVEPMNDRVTLLLAVAVLTGNVEVRSSGQTHVLGSGQSSLFAADAKNPGKVPTVVGKVTAVADDGKLITVEIAQAKKGGEPRRVEVKLTEETRLIFHGIEKDGDKPTVGYAVTAILAEEGGLATQVEFGARKPDIQGRILSVSADGKTITLDIYSKTGPATRSDIRITDRTRLIYAGVDKEGEKPTAGYGALVWLKDGTKDTAIDIQFTGKKGDKGDAKKPDVTGVVVAVSTDGNEITVETPSKIKGQDATKTTVKLTDQTKLGARDGEKPKVGQVVMVTLMQGSKDTAASVNISDKKPGTKKKEDDKPPDPKNNLKKEPDKNKPASGDKGAAPPPGDKGTTGKAGARPAPLRDAAPIAAGIDRELDKQLTEEKLQPSPAADDAEFLRRVSLDIVGRIPTAERAAAFLDDKDPEKRRKLIDELLASPDYGRHFAGIWRNRIVPPEAGSVKPRSDKFTPWLADQFNQNRGWHEVVRELLTVEVVIAQKPQTAFIMANSDNFNPQPNLLAASTSKLFLGVQLQCAECHNHPFARWKQTEFWAMAAFFSRVRKSTEKGLQPMSELTEAPLAETKERASERETTSKGAAIVIPGTAGKGTGQVIKARFLNGVEPALDDQGPYRPVLAAWMTNANNAYFANAGVNRWWAHFMGRGFVNPVDCINDDDPPSHPKALTQLTAEFTASGYDLKHLIRCICNSKAYQRTSRSTSDSDVDPRLFSSMALKIMSPETLYDSLTLVLGKPPSFVDPNFNPSGAKGKGPPVPPRDEFIRFFTTAGDTAEITDLGHGIPQFLRMLNAEPLNRGAPVIDRLLKSGASRERIIETLYLATLSRRPTGQESRLMSEYMAKRDDPEKACVGVLWILLNSSEFVLNH